MAEAEKFGGVLYETSSGSAADGEAPSVSPTYCNIYAKKDYASPADKCKNLFEVFDTSVKQYGDRPCLGKRINGKGEFVWETYKEVQAKVIEVASALASVGVDARGRAAVFSVNCPEWMLVLQACNRMNIYTIPLYDTLGPDAIQYCLKHSESTVIFVSTKNWAALMETLPSLKDQIHTVVFWGSDSVNKEAATSLGLKVYSLDEFRDVGKQQPAEPRLAQPDDLCTIMYTSGTTGPPKGVMIPQTMMLACMRGMTGHIEQLEKEHQINEQDVFLSFLPLAHIFDRMIEEQMLSYGAAIGYYSGDVKMLVDDIGALRPTIFIGVPRVYDRIYAGIMDQINKAGGLKKVLFNYGCKRKLGYMKKGYNYNTASPVFDRLVFSKIKQRLGGRVRAAISGAAPLAPHVEEFMSVALCCHFSQGYGLTETCGSSFLASGKSDMFGSVGVPQPGLEYRLESIPEMKYDALDATSPKGEVCIRGPMVSAGYYKDPEKTAEVFDKDGWFHTGDVGQILPSGGLKIIDRKKQIFKLAQGEYVAVERIEANYKKLTAIQQIFAYGNSMESVLVAVVVPEEPVLTEAAQKEGISFSSYSELLTLDKTKAMLLKQMDATAKEFKMKGFEMIRGLILESEPFSVENDLMTPTFKLKRHQLQEKYKDKIASLYKTLNAKR